MVLTIIGLSLFEILNSLDNAIINSQVLKTIQDKRAKRFFTTWGILVSVFLVRGLGPLLLFYIPNYRLGIVNIVCSFWNGDPAVHQQIVRSTPALLAAGGSFLCCTFIQWLSGCYWPMGLILLLAFIVNERIAMLVALGFTAFIIIERIKKMANKDKASHAGDWTKILALEVIDACFSVDGVAGSFAYTTSVPLILLGNGIGAYVVRWFTIHKAAYIPQSRSLEWGGFCSLGAAGFIMMATAFGTYVPEWMCPVIMLSIISYCVLKHRQEYVINGS